MKAAAVLSITLTVSLLFAVSPTSAFLQQHGKQIIFAISDQQRSLQQSKDLCSALYGRLATSFKAEDVQLLRRIYDTFNAAFWVDATLDSNQWRWSSSIGDSRIDESLIHSPTRLPTDVVNHGLAFVYYRTKYGLEAYSDYVPFSTTVCLIPADRFHVDHLRSTSVLSLADKEALRDIILE